MTAAELRAIGERVNQYGVIDSGNQAMRDRARLYAALAAGRWGVKPEETAQKWDAETALERFVKCKTMLTVHGFLTDAESKKVKHRIDKWLKKNFKQQKIDALLKEQPQ